MNGKGILGSRQGALLMMLFVMLIVGGIVALRMMPNEELITRRDKESSLNTDLSQVREALDLVRVASYPGWIELQASDTPASLSAKIASLAAWGFLRDDDIKDPAVPAHLWGPDKPYYWQVTLNLVTQNPSFEFSLDGWQPSDGTIASYDSSNYLKEMRLDEYPYQNKLGSSLEDGNKKGKAVSIWR